MGMFTFEFNIYNTEKRPFNFLLQYQIKAKLKKIERKVYFLQTKYLIKLYGSLSIIKMHTSSYLNASSSS